MAGFPPLALGADVLPALIEHALGLDPRARTAEGQVPEGGSPENRGTTPVQSAAGACGKFRETTPCKGSAGAPEILQNNPMQRRPEGGCAKLEN
jgi:hypothetical protein